MPHTTPHTFQGKFSHFWNRSITGVVGESRFAGLLRTDNIPPVTHTVVSGKVVTTPRKLNHVVCDCVTSHSFQARANRTTCNTFMTIDTTILDREYDLAIELGKREYFSIVHKKELRIGQINFPAPSTNFSPIIEQARLFTRCANNGKFFDPEQFLPKITEPSTIGDKPEEIPEDIPPHRPVLTFNNGKDKVFLDEIEKIEVLT